MKNGIRKSRLSRITALGMSLVIALNPMMVYADDFVGINSTASVATVSQGDVSPGDVAPGDVSTGDVYKTIDTIFPDDDLAAAIARAMNKDVTDEVSQFDLDNTHSIEISEVMDWTGIERLSNFNDLHIVPAVGYDLKYLAGLKDTGVREIYIFNDSNDPTGITGDIGVFSDLKDLRVLAINDNNEIYGQLSSLPDSLTRIEMPWYIPGDGIEGNVSVLTEMKELTHLAISGKGISGSLSTLAKLPMLTCITLTNTSVTGKLSDLSEMTQLTKLELNKSTPISGSLSEIENLKNLTSLALPDTDDTPYEITGDIQILKDFTNLESLHLGFESKVTGDIANLAGLSKLSNLELFITSVYGDTSSLSGLSLSRVDLNESRQVEGEVSDFANMPLTYFCVDGLSLTGNLSDLGLKSDLTEMNIRKNKIRVKPEDKNLFPNLVTDDDIFEPPVIDTANSNLTYQLGFPDEDWNHIKFRTNKSIEGFAKLLIDGTEVPKLHGDYENYVMGHEVNDQTHELTGELFIWSSYLEQLSVGEHTVTLDYYWGGEVSTKFYIEESPVGTIQELFPDDGLAASVARYMQRDVTDEVFQTELDYIDGLDISEVITDWTGIKHLTNLHDIDIIPPDGFEFNHLAELKDIAALNIFIWNPPVNNPNGVTVDIGVFKDFTDLRKLSIDENIEIYGQLSSLPDSLTLLWLPMQTTDIGIEGSIAELSRMKDLTTFAISGEGINGSISAVADLPKLTELSLLKTSVTGSLSDISHMTQLKKLWLDTDNPISGSLSDIANLKNLTHLALPDEYGTQSEITGDIQILKDFKDLEYFTLGYGSKVTGDIANLAGLSKLIELGISGSSIYGDTSSISGLSQLSIIEMIEAQVVGDISDFADMPLAYFNVDGSSLTGNLSDLGLKSDLTDMSIRWNTIRVKPEDKTLFPNLMTEEDIFVKPVIDTANSNLTYRLGFPDEDGNNIKFRTNKSVHGFAKLLIDGEEIPRLQGDSEIYGIGHEVNDQTRELTGELFIWSSYLEQLSAGEHTATLDYYWGGEVSTTFTVAQTAYTVRFLDPDGNLIIEKAVARGSDAAAPTAPTREGYTFKGWDKAFTNITANLDVTAQYSLNQYVVNFYDFDGTILKSQVVNHGTAAQAPASPSREGYGFTGWNVAFSNVTKSIDVTATYQANLFTVTFVDADGTKLETQTVAYGKPATAPADPTRQGYEFIGWDQGFASVIEDMTVTAMYHEISDNTYIIDKPGVVDGEILNQYDNIIIRSSGVIIDGGKIRGNIRVEAENVILRNLDIAGKVYLLAKETTITDSIIRGSFTVSAESIVMKNLDIRGNLSIGATNITLTDSEVRGNVTIERSVGNGHVELTNVKSKGNIMYVKGGGSNSVVLTDSEFGAIVVDKPAEAGQQAVRVAVQGTTAVANTIVNSAAIIEDTTVEGQGIQNVTLAKEIPAASTVELRGAIKEVTIQKEDLRVVNNAAVETIQVEAPSITLINNATVAELKVVENVTDTKVEGEKIDNVVVADGAELPVYVVGPQTGTDSGNDDDMDSTPHTFLPKGEDGEANPYGSVSVYDDVLLPSGAKAKATLLPVSEAVKAAANEFAKTQDTPNTPFAYVDVVVDGYKSGEVTVKFNLYDIYENDDILVFHQKTDGTWECIIPDKIEDGAVTVTFTSLSPVVFSKAGNAAGNAKVTSPKTSDNAVAAMALLCVLGICAGLGYLQYNRRKYHR